MNSVWVISFFISLGLKFRRQNLFPVNGTFSKKKKRRKHAVLQKSPKKNEKFFFLSTTTRTC